MCAETICEGVVKVYRTVTGEVHALRGIDATFPSGAVTAIVGPSGSGKSSLLRVLAALDRPTAGKVIVEGVNLADLPQRQIRSVRSALVGYVFQQPNHNLIPQLSVRQHLEYARGARIRKRARRSKASSGAAYAGQNSDVLGGTADDAPTESALLEILGLASRARHRPHELSGGEQQRLALGQILMEGSALVVADEPTAELDTRSSGAVLDLIRGLASWGTTVIMSTHDWQATESADQVLQLRDGAVQQETRRAGTATDGEALAVFDSTGRIQLPESAMHLFPNARARVNVREDGVWLSTP